MESREILQEGAQIPPDILDALQKPTFNVWQVRPEEMPELLAAMFVDLDLVSRFRMEGETLRSFLKSVQSHYRANAFHCFHHAFSVTQMMYSATRLLRLQDKLPLTDIVTLLVASLCHDLDHPGLNNTYQVNAGTELALRYQNQSPLENHHCAIALQILRQPHTNIFQNADPAEAQRIMEGIAELILVTDMKHHPSILQELQQLRDFSFSNSDHVTLLKKSLIKFCDISNEIRPAEQAEVWADALMEEYFLQGDREREEGLPVTPYMDRQKVTKAQSQHSFIQMMLRPLCEALSQLLPPLEAWTLQPLSEAMLRYQRQMHKLQGETP